MGDTQALNAAGDHAENLINGYKLLQRGSCFRLGMDAVMLSAFLSPAKATRVCDLGSGAGAVTVLTAARYPEARIDGIEIESEAAGLLRENIELNGLGGRVRAINADLRELEGVLSAGAYTAVVCNPPYFRKGSGRQAETEQRQIQRTDAAADIGDICSASARLLRYGGELAMVCRAERLCDIVHCMREAGIEPKRLKFIHNTLDAAPKVFLISGRRNAGPGLKTDPPLIIRKENGEFTEEYLKVYTGGTL